MAFEVKRFPGESIVIVKFSLPVHENLDELASLYLNIAQILDTCEPPVYGIFDLRDGELGFSDITLWLMEEADDRPGSLRDDRLLPVIVGSGDMVRLCAKKITQHIHHPVPQFASLSGALTFARTELAHAPAAPTSWRWSSAPDEEALTG